MRHTGIISDKAIVSSKGQVVIPRTVRAALGIRAGQELTVVINKEGVIEMRLPNRTIESFFGRGKREGEKALSIAEIDEAIMQAVLEEDDRTKTKKIKRRKK